VRRFALLLAAAPLVASCDPPYEAPCRVVRKDVLASDPAIGAGTAVDLHRTRSRVFASWPKRELSDAGPGDPFPTLAAFEVVTLDLLGNALARETMPTPPELRARRASIGAAGAVVEDGASFVYWVETTTSTDPDGRVRTAYATRLAYRGGAVIAPAAAACTRCRLRIAFASIEDASVAIVRTEPDLPGATATLGAPPPTPVFAALVLHRDGTVVEQAVPWLAIPPAEAALDGGIGGLVRPVEPGLSLEVDGAGRLVLVTDGRTWLVDPSLKPLAGPIALPASDARTVWSSPSEPWLAWSIAPSEEGRASGPYARREIFTGGPDARDRVSRGRAVLAADRAGDEVGVTFESAGRTFFAALDPRGAKRGGDVLLRTNADPAQESEYGTYAPTDASLLVANGGGRFTSVTLGSQELFVAGVVCAP
jgi:hypothetical protein